MRTVFMGTPDFAVPSLGRLHDLTDVALVVTREDAVRSRGRRLEPSQVKARALELGLDVVEASRVTPELVDRVRSLSPDLCVVAAYGCILPDSLLDVARLGTVNVHASSLPRWRGAAPIQRAILAGDERAGVSIMRVVSALDAGDYCRQSDLPIAGATADELTRALAELGADELAAALPGLEDGSVDWVEQDEALVTYARKVSKAEMLLDPTLGADMNLRLVRASSDAAPSRAEVCGRGLRVLAAVPSDASVGCGGVLLERGRVLLGCVDGAIELVEVKPDGKRAMPARAFASGLHGAEATWARVG